MVARDDPTEYQCVGVRPGIDGIHVAGRDQQGDLVIAHTPVDAILTQAAAEPVVTVVAGEDVGERIAGAVEVALPVSSGSPGWHPA